MIGGASLEDSEQPCSRFSNPSERRVAQWPLNELCRWHSLER